MLRVQQLSVDGRRDELLPATSLQVRRGELLLVTGKRQDQRTTLALALSGRFKPAAVTSSGTAPGGTEAPKSRRCGRRAPSSTPPG
ncbi:hypothetical protein ACOM2C_15300 [Pseudarthrobacter sp. So.54]